MKAKVGPRFVSRLSKTVGSVRIARSHGTSPNIHPQINKHRRENKNTAGKPDHPAKSRCRKYGNESAIGDKQMRAERRQPPSCSGRTNANTQKEYRLILLLLFDMRTQIHKDTEAVGREQTDNCHLEGNRTRKHATAEIRDEPNTNTNTNKHKR